MDLPESYKGETWLKLVETENALNPSTKSGELEKPEAAAEIKLEPKRLKRKTR